MATAWLGILGSVIVAALAFVFGRVNLGSATRLQREEDLRRRRVDTYATFCAAVIEYRRAQLHRWHVGGRLGGNVPVENERPEVAEDVRRTRAEAWGQYYHVLMICNDHAVVQQAQHALWLTRQMKYCQSAEDLDRTSDTVHDAVAWFAAIAGRTVVADRPSAEAPPQMVW